MLRADQATLPRAPQHGIEDLPALAEEFTAASLEVALSLPDNPPPMEPGVTLSIYRIIEEALTNTLRHAHAAHAWVTLGVTADTAPPQSPRRRHSIERLSQSRVCLLLLGTS